MIYLKNIREKQTVHIPRTEINSKVVVIKSYDEGYADGIVEGKKQQKKKLTNLTVSENGVYNRENGWNEVKVEIPENVSNTQEKKLIVTRDISVVLPDAGYDAMTKVSVNATQYGQDKRNEGIAIQKSKLTNLSVTANGTYERTDGWNEINVNVPSQTFNLQEKNITLTNDIEEVVPDNDYDALTKVGIDATEFGNKKFSDGHLQGKTEGYENGKADGIEEGYNQGYADGKAEGGDITLTPLIDTPMWEFRNPDNNLTYNPSDYNADGFSTVSLKVDVLYNQGKSEGVEEGYQSGYSDGKTDGIEEGYTDGKADGYAEGYEVGKADVELIEISDIPKMTDVNLNNELVYTPSKYSADGFSKVTINITNIYGEGYNEGYDEGYDDGKNEGFKINLKNEGVKLSNSSFTEVPDWADFSGIIDMSNMFKECLNLTVIPSIDTSLVTRMDMTFENCIGITTIPQLNTSNVTSMFQTFYKCSRLQSIPQLITSNVTDMSGLFRDCTNLTSIPKLNASNVTDISNFLGAFTFDKLTDVGGLTDLKASMDDSFGFAKAPNLTYQSCINILNGLYDFVSNGETPSSSQGKLKVHQNFLNLVGDQITIGNNKGWIITAD